MILTLDRLGNEIIKTLNKNLYVVCYTNQNECSESCKNIESHFVRCVYAEKLSPLLCKSSSTPIGSYDSLQIG